MKASARLFALALAALLTAGFAAAQPAPPASSRPRPAEQPPVPPERPLTEAQRLARMFERLKAAPDAEAAKPIQSQIERAFERSGSDTADILLKRVKESIEAKSFESALDLIDYLIVLKPDWAEAYHRRAIVHFLQNDHESAIRDIRATLAREPRHFHALAGFGTMLRAMGNQKAAYRVYRQVLDIHPHFGDIRQQVEKMKPEVEGKPI